MKKSIVLSLISIFISYYAHADFVLIEKPNTLFLNKSQNFSFEHISFRMLKNKEIMSYAVVNEAGIKKAVKATLYNSYSWDYEDRFKNAEVDYYGSLGNDRILVLKNGDIYTTYQKENKTKWTQKPINFRKYSNEMISSCAGISSNRFWIAVYNNTTKEKKFFELTQNHDNNTHVLNESPYIDVSITPNFVYGWFIAKDNSLLIRELNDEEPEFTTKVILPKTIFPIKSLVAYDEATSYYIDYSGNLYQIDITEDQQSMRITMLEANPLFAISCIGIADGKLIIAHKNRLYAYKPKQKNVPLSRPEKTNRSSTDLLTLSPKIIAQPHAIKANDISTAPTVPLTMMTKQHVAPPTTPSQTQSSEIIKIQNPSAHIRFTKPPQSYLLRLYKSPQIQSMLKRTLGGDSYFYKILKKKNPVDVEREALVKDPKPWERFIPKPTRYESAQYWLFKKTGGWLGNDKAENYPDEAKPIFPRTKEGRRANLLYALSTNNPNYISQWLNKTEWDKLDIAAKERLRFANEGTEPQFQEFWLQEKIQEAIKKLPYSVEKLFADEE